MVDGWTGRWHPEEDYSTYPKEKWCAYDTLCNAIRNDGYVPKTDMENLISMCFAHFDSCLECDDELANEVMKSHDSNYAEACIEWCSADGWSEFDYYC